MPCMETVTGDAQHHDFLCVATDPEAISEQVNGLPSGILRRPRQGKKRWVSSNPGLRPDKQGMIRVGKFGLAASDSPPGLGHVIEGEGGHLT